MIFKSPRFLSHSGPIWPNLGIFLTPLTHHTLIWHSPSLTVHSPSRVTQKTKTLLTHTPSVTPSIFYLPHHPPPLSLQQSPCLDEFHYQPTNQPSIVRDKTDRNDPLHSLLLRGGREGVAGDLVLCQIILATLDIHTVRHLDKYLVTRIVMPLVTYLVNHHVLTLANLALK